MGLRPVLLWKDHLAGLNAGLRTRVTLLVVRVALAVLLRRGLAPSPVRGLDPTPQHKENESCLVQPGPSAAKLRTQEEQHRVCSLLLSSACVATEGLELGLQTAHQVWSLVPLGLSVPRPQRIFNRHLKDVCTLDGYPPSMNCFS